MNVNNAFLNAELDQSSDIYIETPEGFSGLSKKECLRLHKALMDLNKHQESGMLLLTIILLRKNVSDFHPITAYIYKR